MKKYEFIRDTDRQGGEAVSLSNRPKRKLDLIPRLVCLFIAIMVWLWMVNLNDTDVTETMILKIDFAGMTEAQSGEMMIYGMDKTEISVTVQGSNRDIRKYDVDDYKAVIDVSEIEEAGEYTLPVNIITPADTSLTLKESVSLNVTFKADMCETKEIPFDVLVSGIQGNELIGYSYLTESNVDTVNIVGPKSVLSMISSARFHVNGSFAVTSDSMQFSEFPLAFLDKNLNQVNVSDGLISYNTDEITVNVEALAHKSIPITINIKNYVGNKKPVAKPSIDSVEIWGPPTQISQIKEYVIDIEKAEIGKTASHTLTSERLPGDITVKENVITVSFEMPAE